MVKFYKDMLRSIKLVNSVNSSWVRAIRVLHFVIKDGVPFASRELVITIS